MTNYTLIVNGEEIGAYESELDALVVYASECDGGLGRIRHGQRVSRIMSGLDVDWNFCAWTKRSWKRNEIARVSEEGVVVL